MITRYDKWDIEGITFDDVDDYLAALATQQAKGGGGGAATATATATPKATSTPTSGRRTFKIGAKWYVVDLATGDPISPGYSTESEANYHATYTFPLPTAVPATSTPGPTATPGPTSNYQPGANTEGMYSQDMLAMADVGAGPTAAVQSGGLGAIGGSTGGGGGASTMGPNGRTAAQVAGTAYLSEEEAAWYRALPASVKAAVEGGTGASTASGGTTGGTATSAKPSAVPAQYASLMDQFTGFSDKDVVDAYYDGEITRDDLAALITLR